MSGKPPSTNLTFVPEMSEVLTQLKELQTTWRNNDFYLNEGQKVTYDRLLQLRRQRVIELYADGRVSKGSKSTD